MADASRSLLESEQESLYKQLLLESGLSEELETVKSNYQAVVPKPGCCIKTKTENGEKIFINICLGENLPVPREISDEELLALLSSEDPSGFRIPMSIGEPHAEIDKSGNGCTAYDVIIHPEFFGRTQCSQVLMGFFLSVVIEGLEHKYQLSLDREWKMLKNRKFVGSLPEQNIRSQSKPWIMEMDSENLQTGPAHGKSSLISEINSSDSQQEEQKKKIPEPPYSIMQEPAEGYPEFLVAEIHLPKIKSPASMTLDIGEDRILLQTRSNFYHLDIYLPYNLIQEECGAQFNRKTQILTLTLPVQPEQLQNLGTVK